MEGEWISAARAHQIVASALSSGAHLAICSRAFDGLIRARAKRVVAGKRTVDDCVVPQQFWWAHGQAALTQNWATGDFATWIEHTQWRVYGVEFAQEDIESMLPPPARGFAVDRATSGNYAPARRCLDELQKTLGCSEGEAERMILRNASAGLVAGRCKHIWWRVTDRYGSREEEEESHVAIPEWFWEQCASAPDAVLNWRADRFAGKGIVDDAEYKVRITGVELDVGDIVDIEIATVKARGHAGNSAEAADHVAQSTLGSSGRRQSERWRPWIAELVAYIHEKGFPEGEGSQGQEELIRAIADGLAMRGIETLTRSTVQPVVQAVLDRLRGGAEN